MCSCLFLFSPFGVQRTTHSKALFKIQFPRSITIETPESSPTIIRKRKSKTNLCLTGKQRPRGGMAVGTYQPIAYQVNCRWKLFPRYASKRSLDFCTKKQQLTSRSAGFFTAEVVAFVKASASNLLWKNESVCGGGESAFF